MLIYALSAGLVTGWLSMALFLATFIHKSERS